MKIIFFYSTGYCGMGSNEVIEFEIMPSQEELDNIAWEGALENAEMFGVYPDSGDAEENGYSGEDISGFWEVYNEKEHAGLV